MISKLFHNNQSHVIKDLAHWCVWTELTWPNIVQTFIYLVSTIISWRDFFTLNYLYVDIWKNPIWYDFILP